PAPACARRDRRGPRPESPAGEPSLRARHHRSRPCARPSSAPGAAGARSECVRASPSALLRRAPAARVRGLLPAAVPEPWDRRSAPRRSLRGRLRGPCTRGSRWHWHVPASCAETILAARALAQWARIVAAFDFVRIAPPSHGLATAVIHPARLTLLPG